MEASGLARGGREAGVRKKATAVVRRILPSCATLTGGEGGWGVGQALRGARTAGGGGASSSA